VRGSYGAGFPEAAIISLMQHFSMQQFQRLHYLGPFVIAYICWYIAFEISVYKNILHHASLFCDGHLIICSFDVLNVGLMTFKLQ